MTHGGETLCITCGLPAGEPLRMNHLPSGAPCPACRDRLLDGLDAPLPADLMRLGEPKPLTAEEAEEDAPYVAPRALEPAGEEPPVDEDDESGGYKPSA